MTAEGKISKRIVLNVGDRVDPIPRKAPSFSTFVRIK